MCGDCDANWCMGDKYTYAYDHEHADSNEHANAYGNRGCWRGTEDASCPRRADELP